MRRLATAAAIALVTVFAAPAGAQTIQMTPALKQLAVAAEKEGELLVTWSSGTMGGSQGAKAFENAINKAYGTKIRVKWAPGQSMPNVGNQIATAYANKLPSPTDVYMGFSRNMAVLLKRDLFLSAPYKAFNPDRLTDLIVERGTYVKVVSSPLGWSYNTTLAPSVPERLEDFLKPEWKGKIGTTAFGAGFDQIAAADAWGKERALDFARKFSRQVGGFMRCNEIDRLTTGEFVALVTDCSGGAATEARLKGAPIGQRIAPDIPLISYFYFAVPKNAQHPNMGKLFIAFAASKEGQQVIREQSFADLHLYPESTLGPMVRDVEKKYGFTFKHADIAWQLTNEEGNAVQQQIEKILQQDAK